MKIVIAGAGEVGTHLAKMLSQENQDIILMDPNEERLNISRNNMEVLPMVGNPTSLRDLEEAGIRKADLFVSVTLSKIRQCENYHCNRCQWCRKNPILS